MIRRLFMAALPVSLSGSAARAAEPVNLLFDGDSISAGWGAPHGHGLDSHVAAALGPGVDLHNVAVGGRPVTDCLALYSKLVAPLYNGAVRHNVIAFHAGDNDIAAGTSAEAAYSAFTAYVSAAHAQGWKIAVSTEMLRPDFPAEKERELAAYNTMLRRNRARADAVVDFDKDRRIADFASRKDPAVFSGDGIHPNEGGYVILAGMLAPAVKRIAGR